MHERNYIFQQSSILGLMFYPESQQLIISTSVDGTVRLWSLVLNECLYNVQVRVAVTRRTVGNFY